MKSVLFLLGAVLFWALNFYLGKIMMEYVSPNLAAFWRYFIGVSVLLVIAFKDLPAWTKIKESALGIVLVGFIGLFGFNFFFFQGLKTTAAINAALIISLNPATTVILSAIFQGHKIDLKQVVGILVALLGVICLLTEGHPSAILEISLNQGDLLLFISNVLFATQNLWIRKYASKLGNLNFTTLTNLCCLLGFVVLIGFEANFPISTLPVKFWLAALGMGLPGTAVAYYFWNYGMNDLGPARGAIFGNATPLFVAMFAIVFGAPIEPYHLICTGLIISGLLIMQLSR